MISNLLSSEKRSCRAALSRENAYLLALWDRWRFIRNHSFRYSPRNTDFRIRSFINDKNFRRGEAFFLNGNVRSLWTARKIDY